MISINKAGLSQLVVRRALAYVYFEEEVARHNHQRAYSASGRLFACRHCHRLVYASQQESAHQRGLWKSQKIRIRLRGYARMLGERPKRHRNTSRRPRVDLSANVRPVNKAKLQYRRAQS